MGQEILGFRSHQVFWFELGRVLWNFFSGTLGVLYFQACVKLSKVQLQSSLFKLQKKPLGFWEHQARAFWALDLFTKRSTLSPGPRVRAKARSSYTLIHCSLYQISTNALLIRAREMPRLILVKTISEMWHWWPMTSGWLYLTILKI